MKISKNIKVALIVFVITAIGAGCIYYWSAKKPAAGKYSVADFKGLTRTDMIAQLPIGHDYSGMSDEQVRIELVTYKNKTS